MNAFLSISTRLSMSLEYINLGILKLLINSTKLIDVVSKKFHTLKFCERSPWSKYLFIDELLSSSAALHPVSISFNNSHRPRSPHINVKWPVY